MLNVAQLKAILVYDRETGVFIWRSGQQAGRAAGSRTKKGYIVIRIAGIAYRAHRLAWLYVTGAWPPGLLDHKNVCPWDNRFDNLREARLSQNLANRRPQKRKANPGLPKGVLPSGKQFRAEIYFHGKRTHLGCFADVETAAAAYRKAALAEFGEFART